MQSEHINEIIPALCKAQKTIKTVEKDREVSYGNTSFKYATLDRIIEHVREPLTDNDLWFTQAIANGDGKYRLITTVYHKSGQWLRSEAPIMAQSTKNQDFGSALTYMKRYSLSSMLGIAADDDDDANSADGTPKETKGIGAPGNKRTGIKAVDQWLNQQIGVLANAATIEELRQVYPAIIKEAQKNNCTDDQLALLTDQKNNRKEFLTARSAA